MTWRESLRDSAAAQSGCAEIDWDAYCKFDQVEPAVSERKAGLGSGLITYASQLMSARDLEGGSACRRGVTE